MSILRSDRTYFVHTTQKPHKISLLGAFGELRKETVSFTWPALTVWLLMLICNKGDWLQRVSTRGFLERCVIDNLLLWFQFHINCVFYVLLFLSSTWWWTFRPKHVGEKNIINCCVLTGFVVVLTSWRLFSMRYAVVLFRCMVVYLSVLFPRLWCICSSMIGFSFLTWQDKERKTVWWGQHVYR